MRAGQIQFYLGGLPEYYLNISDPSDPSVFNRTEGYISIFNQTIDVETPEAMSTLVMDNSYDVNWTTTGSVSKVNISLYENDILYDSLINDTNNDGYYNWTVPTNYMKSDQYQIRIVDSSNASVYNFTDYFFPRTPDT